MPDRTLLERSLAAVWHPCTQMKAHETLPLVPIARGQGPWLFDTSGRRYLDAISSWWVNLFGHAHPVINAALREQLEQLEHVMLAGFTHEPVVALSERLHALTAQAFGTPLGHAFYASDGASATEIALKMSAHFWRNAGRSEKTRFVSLAGGYHGETLGALAVTDVPIFREAYAPLLPAHFIAPCPDARQASPGESAADVALRAARSLESLLEAHHRQIAALILEPQVQCANHFAMYDPIYLEHARALCDRFEVHLIADEIAVGCGRTGRFFASEGHARPDFLCLSKGISGGYLPLSLVMTTDEVFDAFYDDTAARGFLHSHSYTGNPLACRAALATLDLFESERVIETNRTRAGWLLEATRDLAAHPAVRHFRSKGMMIAFDVATEHADFSRRFFARALEHELLLRPIGNTVYFMPPYVLDEETCQWLGRQALLALQASLSS
jgi:adenosylmethionine-8-amino-7-oxononanoate aminotransferase